VPCGSASTPNTLVGAAGGVGGRLVGRRRTGGGLVARRLSLGFVEGIEEQVPAVNISSGELAGHLVSRGFVGEPVALP
jgi:hypothetical protein